MDRKELADLVEKNAHRMKLAVEGGDDLLVDAAQDIDTLLNVAWMYAELCD